jgi:hypothetical protein
MRLGAETHVDRPIEAVRAFFADPDSLVRWDRSVVKTVAMSDGPVREGFCFHTIGPGGPGREGKISRYRIIELAEDGSSVELLDSPVFEAAVWTLRFEREASGTRIRCEMSGSMRRPYGPLGWLLRLNRRALEDDMHYLRRALENGEIAKR